MAKGLNLKAVISLDAKQFQQGIGKIQQQLGSIGSAMKQAFAFGSVAMLGKSILMATKNFEDAMARVKAVSNASASEMKMMNDEALRLGATTRYTATQVAETLEVLTRNGFNAQKATKSLAATLQLAQANAVDLAYAGNAITNVLNMFGLGVDQVQRVNDVMSSIASNTATNLQDFYDALVNAAPMAHALGISIEETAAALGSLAQRGIKGADAGTQLRMALQKMVDPSSMKKLKALGIEIDEEIIKAEGLKGVLEKLNAANLSVSQLNEIFTVRSSKSILQLVRAVDDFNNILKITENSSGTALRMFTEGVGSVRKELDVLRSVWENLLISIGNSTKGPINGIIRGLQNVVTSFKSGWGIATNFFTILILGFRRQMAAAMQAATTTRTAAKIEANELLLKQKQHDLVTQRKILNNKKSTASDIAAANATIAATNKEIAAIRSKIAVLNAWRAVLVPIYGILIALASVALEQLIVKIIAANREVKEANNALKETESTIQKTSVQLGVIKSMIGDGSNKDSLNGAIKMSTELFPQFADAITQAAIAAGKTKNYEKLKTLLDDISKLQAEIARRDAQTQIANANIRKLGTNLFSSTQFLSPRQEYTPFFKDFRSLLEKTGLSKDEVKAVMTDVATIIVTNSNKSMDEQVLALKQLLDGYGFIKTSKEIRTVLTQVSKGMSDRLGTKGVYNLYVDNGYIEGSKAVQNASQSAANAERQESDIRFNDAWAEYIRLSKDAAKDLGEGTKEYKKRMSELVDALEEKTKDLTLTSDKQMLLYDARKKYPSQNKPTSSTVGDTGSGSHKKTDWEKFTDLLDEYPKKAKEFENQLKNGAITRAEYDKEIVKLNVDTWKAIAAISDLDSKMKSLSKAQIETIDTVKNNVPQDADVANTYSELVNALHDFDKKKIEIVNKNDQGAYADPSEFVDALSDLEDETYKSISSLKGLEKAVEWLNSPLKKLYRDVTEASKANKDYAERMKNLELPNTLPPKFEGRDAQDIINKRDQYADVVNLLNEYEKQRLKLDMQRSKKAITDEQYDKNLATLNGVVGISLGQFRNLNEITSKLPQSLKNLYDEINNFKLPQNGNNDNVDENSFISVLDNYYDKSLRLLEQKVNGSLDDTEYEKELEKLAKETINNISNFEKLGKVVEFLPSKYQEVYNALVELKEKIENTDVNVGDNTGNTTPKTPTVPESAPPVEVNPIVNVTVNIDSEEVGKNINVTVDTEKDETENKDLIDEIKKWQKAVEKANKGKKQVEIEEEVGTEKIEIQLELKQDEIERIQKRIQEIYSSGEKGENGITILTQEAIKELEELMGKLKKAMNDAETLGEMKTLASGIVQLQSGMDDFAKTAIDNISNVASAFDRLMSAIESIAEAFGQELEWEGLKKVMSVINGTIQVMEALRSIIVTVQAVQDIATKKKVANAGKEVIANAAVTASEETKASAEAAEAVAGGASSVASVPYVGAALAVAAIGAITAALLAGMQKFAGGGIVQGSTKGDKNIVRANGGEAIITKAQQATLYRAISEGRLGSGGAVEFVIRGDQLIGCINNYNRKWN